MKKNVLHTMMIALLAGGSAMAQTPPAAPPPVVPPAQPGPPAQVVLDRTVAIAERGIEAIARDEAVTLMSAELRTVGLSGLLIQLSAECGLWHSTPAIDGDPPIEPGDADADLSGPDALHGGRVLVWVEVDGEPVGFDGDADDDDAAAEPVDADAALADARVALCGGVATRVAAADGDGGEDEDLGDGVGDGLDEADGMTVQFEQVRQAAAFNWAVDRFDNGDRRVEVRAIFEADDADAIDLDGEAAVQAAIGKRTLVIQPIRLGM